MNIGLLFVPFILSDFHRRAAQRTLESIQSKHSWKTYGVVNAYRAGTDDYEWLQRTFQTVSFNDKNCLARAWNQGIEMCLADGASHVLVSNLDIVFHPEAIDRLLLCAERNPEALLYSPTRWYTPRTLQHAQCVVHDREGFDWSCFLVDKRLFELVGYFDEVFSPAYQEDSDMVYRMHLKGYRGVIARDAYMYHVELGTLKGCLEITSMSLEDKLVLLRSLRNMVAVNDQRYVDKWGGLPTKETFTIPYNGVSLS